METSGTTEDQEPRRESDPVTTAARLMIGTASLALDAVTGRLQTWGRQSAPAVSEVVPHAKGEGSLTDALIGMAARGVRTAVSLGARGSGMARRGVRVAEALTEAAGKLVPYFLNEPIDRAREEARRRILRLEAAGRQELERSRAIARAALDDGLDSVLARVADSRELQFVIRTQSVTAAEEAVDGIRDQAARIDDRLEGAARKLLRRHPRPPATASR